MGKTTVGKTFDKKNVEIENEKLLNRNFKIIDSDHSFWKLRKEIENKSFEKDILVKSVKHAKDIVWYLSVNEIDFIIINMGCGIRKIVKENRLCPNCFGKGIIK